MAIAALEIPHITPLRFVGVDGEVPLDPRANLRHFDADWFTNLIRDWQTKTDYVQKWQFNDRVAVYMKANSTFGATVALIDCHGRVWHTWTLSQYIFAPNNTIKTGTGSVPAFDYYKRFRFAEVAGLPEGIYWLYMEVDYDLDGDSTVDYYRHKISEPLSIATLHPGTSFIDYYNNTNSIDLDVLFVQFRARFSKRIKADIVDYSPASNDTQYEDGQKNAVLIASQPYRTAKYALTQRVPDWEVDKLNRAWSCSNVSVDGAGFTKEIGGKFEVGRIPRFPKVMASLPIREADHRQGAREIVATSFQIFTQTGYPYLPKSIRLVDASGQDFYFDGMPLVIHNTTEEAAFVTALNNYAASEGYSGNVVRTVALGVQEFDWRNAGADLFISGNADVLTSPLTMQLSTTNTAEAIGFVTPNVFVDFGDGSVEEISGYGPASSSQHTYITTGTHNLYIFGSYEGISFDDGYLHTVGGSVPANLRSFVIKNSFTITSFDCTVLAQANATLATLSVYSCSSLTAITNRNLLAYGALTLISFAQDGLSTTTASTIVDDVYQAIEAIGQATGAAQIGALYINGQGPAAPMNGTGASAKTNLIDDYGWTVITD